MPCKKFIEPVKGDWHPENMQDRVDRMGVALAIINYEFFSVQDDPHWLLN
jgi:hypothetical protein